MSVAGNKIRIYDLAKELKQDTKRIIEELRREGEDVSVPSNTVSKELAEKIRNRYFTKTQAAAAPAPAEEVPEPEVIAVAEEPAPEIVEPEIQAEETPQVEPVVEAPVEEK